MIEHNNRQKAKALAEFITGDPLRRYLADKVHQYVGENVSVFDGAAGSGQLCQHLDVGALTAVEIQPESCKALQQNYPNAVIYNQSFFDYEHLGDLVDCVIMNPPFSIKFKELSINEQQNIQTQFTWKKSGVVDDIFILKSLEYSKRFAFYIISAGVGYRQTEKQFRQILGNQVAEINRVSNAFTDTAIDVLFLVIDKQKTDNRYTSELLDCKTGECHQDTFTVDTDHWQTATAPKKSVNDDINIDQLNQDLLSQIAKRLDITLKMQKEMVFLTGIDFNGFCERLIGIIRRYQ